MFCFWKKGERGNALWAVIMRLFRVPPDAIDPIYQSIYMYVFRPHHTTTHLPPVLPRRGLEEAHAQPVQDVGLLVLLLVVCFLNPRASVESIHYHHLTTTHPFLPPHVMKTHATHATSHAPSHQPPSIPPHVKKPHATHATRPQTPTSHHQTWALEARSAASSFPVRSWR